MKVLVAIDADCRSERVVAWARALPGLLHEAPTVTLLHVVPIPLEGPMGVQDQTYDLDLQHMRESVRSRLPDLMGCCNLEVRAGNPGQVICEVARDYDLVVLGSSGRSQMSELLLGGTSAYVAHHAPCAVLLLRPEAHTPAA